MLVMYLGIMFMLLSLRNIYIVWLIMELIFLFFLLIIVIKDRKRTGLVIYFFFQRVLSLLLFMRIFFVIEKCIFILMLGKLGMFPFYYWIVVVRIKVGILGNIFVLGLQKVRVFWILWLGLNVSIGLIYFMVYLSIFFVILSLLIVRDFWLILVYSSIANTGMLVISSLGSNYFYCIILYLRVVIGILLCVGNLSSYNEMIIVIFMFLVVPPFLLFFIKFYVILRVDFFLKLGFFVAFFDVLVLLYYFRLIFIKFILFDNRVIVYLVNFLMLVLMLLIRNCVAMIIFN